MTEPRDLAALERELEQLKQQLPRHSVPAAFLLRIEELEEEIAARKKVQGSKFKVQVIDFQLSTLNLLETADRVHAVVEHVKDD